MKPAVLATLWAAASASTISQPHFSRRRDGNEPTLVGRATGSVLVKTFGTPYATYMVNATVGTPPQNFSLLVAPSSPYTWVPDADGYYCASDYVKDESCLWGSRGFLSISSTAAR